MVHEGLTFERLHMQAHRESKTPGISSSFPQRKKHRQMDHHRRCESGEGILFDQPAPTTGHDHALARLPSTHHLCSDPATVRRKLNPAVAGSKAPAFVQRLRGPLDPPTSLCRAAAPTPAQKLALRGRAERESWALLPPDVRGAQLVNTVLWACSDKAAAPGYACGAFHPAAQCFCALGVAAELG